MGEEEMCGTAVTAGSSIVATDSSNVSAGSFGAHGGKRMEDEGYCLRKENVG